MELRIKEETDNPVINFALDTIRNGKQALVFVNTKKSAEKTAEDIAKKLKSGNPALKGLSRDILKALSRPTRQCEREAYCIARGIAFHHSGLTSRQRSLTEDNFRNGLIKIICATPTLALGVELPAYRAIIKDLRRYGARGLTWIPVLEYYQMAGRAGRPTYDTEGQAIAIASTKAEKEKIVDTYINGQPEEIYSKLAVEPVLRIYVLSLISSNFVSTRKEILNFFNKTFYAHQFEELRRINSKIDKILDMLCEWEFLIRSGDDFTAADNIDNEKFRATLLGKRVSELYVDPLTANHIINCIRNSSGRVLKEISFLQMICHTEELRPLLRVRNREYDDIQEELLKKYESLLEKEPSMYDPEYEDFIGSVKTALMFEEWIGEKEEDYLLEKYNIRPGELKNKLDIADWMLYATSELCKILHFQYVIKEIAKLRLRLKYGVKEELLPLLRLEGIGRVKGRALYRNRIRDLRDVKNADLSLLKQLIGNKTAERVKRQVGQLESKKAGREETSLSDWLN